MPFMSIPRGNSIGPGRINLALPVHVRHISCMKQPDHFQAIPDARELAGLQLKKTIPSLGADELLPANLVLPSRFSVLEVEADYQIITRFSGGRYMPSVSLMPKAS